MLVGYKRQIVRHAKKKQSYDYMYLKFAVVDFKDHSLLIPTIANAKSESMTALNLPRCLNQTKY